MSVYVDSMKAPFRGMVMCHMVADTAEELLAMADRIELNRKWLQFPGTFREHFDIGLAKKLRALHAGAIEVTKSQLGEILQRKREASLETSAR